MAWLYKNDFLDGYLIDIHSSSCMKIQCKGLDLILVQ
jgi:hypothetical protein